MTRDDEREWFCCDCLQMAPVRWVVEEIGLSGSCPSGYDQRLRCCECGSEELTEDLAEAAEAIQAHLEEVTRIGSAVQDAAGRALVGDADAALTLRAIMAGGWGHRVCGRCQRFSPTTRGHLCSGCADAIESAYDRGRDAVESWGAARG